MPDNGLSFQLRDNGVTATCCDEHLEAAGSGGRLHRVAETLNNWLALVQWGCFRLPRYSQFCCRLIFPFLSLPISNTNSVHVRFQELNGAGHHDEKFC